MKLDFPICSSLKRKRGNRMFTKGSLPDEKTFFVMKFLHIEILDRGVVETVAYKNTDD